MKIKNIHIVILLSLIIVSYLGFYAYKRIMHNKWYGFFTLDVYNGDVELIYKKYPQLFIFNEAGECIITVEDLLKGQDDYDFDIMYDKSGNACIGYYIINKDLDNNIEIDSSHICDMIDY